jgi:hypothetical protein
MKLFPGVAVLGAVWTVFGLPAGAHSASDAYLTLTAAAPTAPFPTSGTAAPARTAAPAGTAAAAPAGTAGNATAAPAGSAGPPGRVLHGQWDIALKDLNFVLNLDDDGDGHVTWGETKHHHTDIERYAMSHLRLADAAGSSCAIKPTGQLIDDHADGAYLALFFDVMCAQRSKKLKLDYSLFFDIDPSHRGIFVLHDGDDIATSVLAPQNAAIDLVL